MKSTVYFTKEISPAALVRIFEALNRDLTGKVAVKISTGEAGNPNYLQPDLIAPLVEKLNGTIVECCTAYEGKRMDPGDHWQTIKDHGFTRFPCDILDEKEDMEIPIETGFHLSCDIVGKHLENYDSALVLSHFKGHPMGGFGGALKNMSIGFASSRGKAHIHTAGKSDDVATLWQNCAPQDDFLEAMADACHGIIDFFGAENMAYVSIANRLSVDCDCVAHPEEPKMGDLGIFASLDPVALDRACYDAVRKADDPGKIHLIERMETRHAIHIVEAAEHLGLGSQAYELIEI